MIYEQVLDAIDDLGSRWSDIARSVGALAKSLPAADPQNASVLSWSTQIAQARAQLQSQQGTLSGSMTGKTLPTVESLIDLALPIFEASNQVLAGIESLAYPQPQGQTLTMSPAVSPGMILKLAAPVPAALPGILDHLQASPDSRVVAQSAVLQFQLESLRELINENIQELSESRTPAGGLSSMAGIRRTVDDISTYPMWTQEMAAGSTPAPSGSSSSPGSSSPLGMGRLVEQAMSQVLGRRARVEDSGSFVAALNQSFTRTEQEGHTVCTWVKRASSGVTELGASLTGAQASLYQRAKVAQDNVLPLVETLFALRDDSDPEDVAAVRSIVRNEFSELVGELGADGGPRVARVDDLFELLIKRDYPSYDKPSLDIRNSAHYAELGLGEVGRLGDVLGMTRDLVNTVEEEQNLTNYMMVKDYISSLYTSWGTFRSAFTGGVDNYLGTQLVLITRSLGAVAEQVDEVAFAMDSVFLGATERQTIQIDFPDPNVHPPMYVADLLDWVRTYCTQEGTRVIQDGGKIGVRAIVPTLTKLRDLIGASSGRIRHPGARHPRVIRTLESLKVSLADAARLSGTIQ